ncbi:MAG: nucleoside deaminase [Planctomycetes bacterium]|nr:nucleoside deaminase [Planctomycetota bacterium]MCC7399529.1 nucleoside deaminase [Planctomycetota bacterium]
MDHEQFLRQAIELAATGMRQGRGGPFGCVIVRHGVVVGRGSNEVTSSNDPTAHAEVVAMRAACRELGTFRLDDCTLYTSCEPCPMCLAAVYWARIPTLFYGNRRSDAASIGFDDELIYTELARPIGERRLRMQELLRDEALAGFREWAAKGDRTPY